jgi:plastocyanin
MRRTMLVIGVLLILAAGAVQAVRIASAANFAVTAANSQFQDASGDENTTINVGDTVTWTFADGQPHTVTADGGAFDSGAQQSSGTFQFTFASAGTFDYYCEVHGQAGGLGMSGTITVQAAPTNTPPAATNTPAGATSTATRTPTRTATPAPTSTGTVTAVPTSAAATSTPIVTAPISATQPPAGGTRPAVIAPAVGTGDATSGARAPLHALSIAIGVVGAICVAGATMLAAGSAVRIERRS